MTESRTNAFSHTSSTPTVIGGSEEHYASGSTKRFRETVESIPSPEDELQGRRPKTFEPYYAKLVFTLGTPLVFIIIGVALEVATEFSKQHGGFRVPTVNVFGVVSGQFLASIIPSTIILPFTLLYREHDWLVRSFQPYVVLQRGNACAEESLLLDYISLGPLFSLFHAMRWKHRIVFLSALTCFITYTFQPLASSIFQIRQVPQTDKTTVRSIETITLANDINQLNAFLAGAGYVDAAALHGLGDPPFVFNNWTTAAFLFPEQHGINDTLIVNTTAITTGTNCANPAGGSIKLVSLNDTSFNLTSTSVDNCSPFQNITFDTAAATQQYGVVDVNCTNKPENDLNFRPVMFWYFQIRDDHTAEAKTVFCTPTLEPFLVTATAHLLDGRLDSCLQSSDFHQSNDVTGPPNNGKAFNGLIFNPSPDPFIQARATAISSGVSGTIFRTASRKLEGLQAIFDRPNGMLDLTSQIYTQHLAVSAKAVYFIPQNSTITAEKTSLLPRLVIDPLPGHFLALCLFIVGISGLLIHFINYRQRRQLILAAPPGSIASITALTARSGFGDLILPYDNELQLERKLDGIKFRLDRRTGAIVADDVMEGVPGMGRDDAMLALLGKHNERLTQHSTSSQVAYQTSVGYPPWVYKTPYDKLSDQYSD